MLGGLFCPVAVGFERQHDEPGGAAEAADRCEKPLGLDRERAGVVVGLAMDH